MGSVIDSVLDDVLGFDPPPEPAPPPPPPPIPETVLKDDATTVPEQDLEDLIRERNRKEASRRGYSSLVRDYSAVSTPGTSGVNII